MANGMTGREVLSLFEGHSKDYEPKNWQELRDHKRRIVRELPLRSNSFCLGGWLEEAAMKTGLARCIAKKYSLRPSRFTDRINGGKGKVLTDNRGYFEITVENPDKESIFDAGDKLHEAAAEMDNLVWLLQSLDLVDNY